MGGGRRARNERQKGERRQALLDAAWRLFAVTPHAEITMTAVAAGAGLAKGTTYLYFTGKEDLFLAMLEDELRRWFTELDAALAALPRPAAGDAVAELLCDTLAAHPALTRLLALLHGVLERNIDLPTALRFKRFLRERLMATGALLEAALPFLAPGQGTHLLLRCHALVIGLGQMADPAPVVRQALTDPDLRIFDIDFAREFSGTVRVLISGMEREARS